MFTNGIKHSPPLHCFGWRLGEARSTRWQIQCKPPHTPGGRGSHEIQIHEQVWCKALEIQIISATQSVVKHYTPHTLIHSEAQMEYKKIYVYLSIYYQATCRLQSADVKYKYKKQGLLRTIHNTDRPIWNTNEAKQTIIMLPALHVCRTIMLNKL